MPLTFLTNEDYDKLVEEEIPEAIKSAAPRIGLRRFSTVAGTGVSVMVTQNGETHATSILDGQSAYQIAVDNGFEGTEDEWLDSLHEGLQFIPNDEQDGEPEEITFLTDCERESIVQEVIDTLGTPVFGSVDLNKVITLSGNLVPGEYTLKYDGTDGVIIKNLVEG